VRGVHARGVRAAGGGARRAPLTRTLEALGAVVVGAGEGEDALLVNVNTPADLARAETLLSAGGGG
jgi:CTP:molybdopterin cytidylyltransferase MocA